MSKKKTVLGDDVHIENIGLIQQVENRMTTRGEAVMEVPLDKVRERENVRSEYKGLDELAASIKEKGLLQPIVITPADGGFYEIIFGHRRYRALVQLKAEAPETYFKIKAIVREKGAFDAEEIKEVQLIENIQREALSTLELKGALEYLRARGLSNQEVASRLGKSKGYVDNLFMAMKTVNQNPELEGIMKTHPGVSLADLQYLRVLGKAELLKLAEEKAKGLIKTRVELEKRIEEVKAAAYGEYREKREEKQGRPFFSLKDSRIKVRSFSVDLGELNEEEKLLATEFQKLLGLMETLVKSKTPAPVRGT